MDLWQEKETLQMMNEVKDKMKALEVKIKELDRSVFIELVGTPKSGKTTLKNALIQLFSNSSINFIARRETAEYNPISKDSEQYNPWMIFELFKNLSEDLSKKTGDIIIYDRGALDRIPWMQYDVINGRMTQKDYEKILQLYNMDIFNKYNPITKIFITSPKLSVKRKGGEGTFVNIKSMNQFNETLRETIPIIKSKSSFADIVYTDKYEGNVQKFILENTYDILSSLEYEIDKIIEDDIKDINDK